MERDEIVTVEFDRSIARLGGELIVSGLLEGRAGQVARVLPPVECLDAVSFGDRAAVIKSPLRSATAACGDPPEATQQAMVCSDSIPCRRLLTRAGRSAEPSVSPRVRNSEGVLATLDLFG